jgi:hypothetical protein
VGLPKGIQKLTSIGGTVTITDPTGPTTDLSVSGGGGPSPSDTVVGPDSFDSPSDAGTANEYSRGDHDHGLPAASGGSLAMIGGNTTGDVTISGSTDVLDTDSLGVGTWIVSVSALLEDTTDTPNRTTVRLEANTATATFSGPRAAVAESEISSGAQYISVSFTCLVTVTVEGTLSINAYSPGDVVVKELDSVTAFPVTGYTALGQT